MTRGANVRSTARLDGNRQSTDLSIYLNRHQPILGAFSVAGFPDERGGVDALVAYANSGASVLEVGAPAAFPLLDGPVITAAHHHALRSGHGRNTTLATVQQVSARTGTPVIVISYWATVLACGGPHRVATELASAGAAGCLVPDVPPLHVEEWAAAARGAGINAPLLADRAAPPDELVATCQAATGFVYAPAVAGQRTGYSDGFDLAPLASFIASVRRAASATPVLTGIGVSNPDLAASVVGLRGVSGVAVGSSLIQALTDGGLSRAAGLVEAFAASIARTRGDDVTHRTASPYPASRRSGLSGGAHQLPICRPNPADLHTDRAPKASEGRR
ncbi:tryptophan synthase subunit alpha (plasmid) [Streptomyces sp. NBC_00445]|uniref:tryptophan synthase subunit alpha n=1 Tax=Streptomyces sp. NBC_00445 TaxID=2975745 RepID=UPI002E21F563